jgi:hypothetical protein
MKTEDQKKPEKSFFFSSNRKTFAFNIHLFIFIKIKFTALDVLESFFSIEDATTEGASNGRTSRQDSVDSDHASSSDDDGHEDINGNKAGACNVF